MILQIYNIQFYEELIIKTLVKPTHSQLNDYIKYVSILKNNWYVFISIKIEMYDTYVCFEEMNQEQTLFYKMFLIDDF